MKRDRQSVNIRHAEMLALIRDRQEVLVDELSQAFGISTMTVRRDLQALEEQGKISRFHGGATVDLRSVSAEEKDQVAQCRRLIRPLRGIAGVQRREHTHQRQQHGPGPVGAP